MDATGLTCRFPCGLSPSFEAEDVVDVLVDDAVDGKAVEPLQLLHRRSAVGAEAAVGALRVEAQLLKAKLDEDHVPAGRALDDLPVEGDAGEVADDLHPGAGGNPLVQLLDVAVEHADASGAGPGAAGPGLVGAVDAVDAPGDVQSHPAGAEATSPVADLMDDLPFAHRRQGELVGPADRHRISLVRLAVYVEGQLQLVSVDDDHHLAFRLLPGR